MLGESVLLRLVSKAVVFVTATALFGAAARASVEAGGSGEVKPVIRLMSGEQYVNSIAYVFGPDIKIPSSFPPLRRIDGLDSVGASAALVPPSTFNTFNAAAKSIAAQVVDPAHRQTLIACRPASTDAPDDPCAAKFFGEVGRLLFRRPLRPSELSTYVGAARRAGSELQDFYAGVRFALVGMMVAPQFMYFVESTEQDPNHPGGVRLDGFSKAIRLSLLLWNSAPDDELLRAAERGDLQSDAGLRRQVDRMLGSRRLVTGVRAFFSDMLFLESFADMVKDPVLYPAFSAKVAADSREQILRILEDQLLTQQADYREIFTTQRTFMTQALASVYRVPVSVPGPLDWVPYDLPKDDPRAGLLTQVGFLAVNSHPGRSSATRRGKALRELLMCQSVPDPPPNVDFSAIVTPDPAIRTARERLGLHTSNPVCAGCHKITDPIGLSLENFDGAGQFRQQEKGADIDASGSIAGKKFSNPKEMGSVLANDPSVSACLVKRLYQYGIGRTLAPEEKPVLKAFEGRFASDGYRLVPLLRTFATSDAFYAVSASQLSATASPTTASAVHQ